MNNREGLAERLLSRLECVRATRDGQWIARCPAHDDHTPSLSIKEAGDGVLLVHCFASCTTADVVAAVGLELSDLFPSNRKEHMMPGDRGRTISNGKIRYARKVAAHEALIAWLSAEDMFCGRPVDVERLVTAAARLKEATEILRGNPRGSTI